MQSLHLQDNILKKELFCPFKKNSRYLLNEPRILEY